MVPPGSSGAGGFAPQQRAESDATLPAIVGPTDLQRDVACGFFELEESDGFAVHGGLALSALGTTTRTSEDIDLFTSRGEGAVPRAFEAFERLAEVRGWALEVVRRSDNFIRFEIKDGRDSTLVDLAHDSPPLFSVTQSPLGPTLSEEESLGRKLVTVFSRTEPRDFSDLYILANKYSRGQAVRLAKEIDLGFDEQIATRA